MMAYTAKTPMHLSVLEAGSEIEVEADVAYTVTKYHPATMTDPEEPATVEILSFRLRKPTTGDALVCPAWVVWALEDDESFLNWLLAEAVYQDGRAKEWAAEMRADDARVDTPALAKGES